MKKRDLGKLHECLFIAFQFAVNDWIGQTKPPPGQIRISVEQKMLGIDMEGVGVLVIFPVWDAALLDGESGLISRLCSEVVEFSSENDVYYFMTHIGEGKVSGEAVNYIHAGVRFEKIKDTCANQAKSAT